MIALDLFAGHGWGVACQRLGIEEYGVEIMPEAVATRTANGMHTLYHDVWEGLKVEPDIFDAYKNVPGPHFNDGRAWMSVYDLLIASPPCQTFSMAGNGAGRKALDEVLEAIETRAYLDPIKLRDFGEKHDPRTALVLTPLAHVARDVPTYVVFEQVPPVLPVWEACAEHMRRWGYSVWTGNLQAEMYGVPQTRKRAVLIARADGIEAAPPTPTHSRYYSRDPQRLDEGVLPWVSMAEALGWGMNERPYVSVAAGTASGGTDPAALGGSAARKIVTDARDEGRWTGEAIVTRGHHKRATRSYLVGNQVPPGSARDEYHGRRTDAPAQGITGQAGSYQWSEDGKRTPRLMRSNFSAPGAPGATAAERGRTLRHESMPSLAMTGKPGHWVDERPATTVAGDSRVWAPGHKVNAVDRERLGEDEANERYGDRAGTTALRVTIAEAAILQSYPPEFVWDTTYQCPKTGRQKPVTKTSQFQQVGNAVPPLLAEAILKGFMP